VSILVTGSAGFIGYHLCDRLLMDGLTVVGIDNHSVISDRNLQLERVARFRAYQHFYGYEADILDPSQVREIMVKHDITTVIHLAAKTGIRASQIHPEVYLQTNIIGFHNLLHLSQQLGVNRFIFASSSSVYGKNDRLPFREDHPLSPPLSIYGATKQANEAIAHTYAQRGGMTIIGLRLFTVYGSYYRCDMAFSKFAQALTSGNQVLISGQGEVARDFTYIGDVVSAIKLLLHHQQAQPALEIFNVGSGRPIPLTQIVYLMGAYLNLKPQIQYQPLAPEELVITHADLTKLSQTINFTPQTTIVEGVSIFLEWYLSRNGLG
jgi:UDP-glucuronate 4-epimerase